MPNGTEVDAGYAQWHSDGTEIDVSGLRAPLTGDVCLGEWIKTGARTYQLNHFGISYDATGVNLVGPARIQQWLTMDPEGMQPRGNSPSISRTRRAICSVTCRAISKEPE